MKLIFFEEELLTPTMDVNNKIYTKEMKEDLSNKKIGVILGNNGFSTALKSMRSAIENNYYAIITNQVYLMNMECFIDEDGTRDVYIASLNKNLPLEYIEDYLGKEINRNDNLELIYRKVAENI